MLKCTYNRTKSHGFLRCLAVLCLVACISAFLFIFSSKANAHYSYQLGGITSNSTLLYDNNGVYVVSFSGSNLDINYITDNTIEKRTIKISGDIKNIATHNGIIYAISSYKDTLYLNSYTYTTDTLNSFIINCTAINSNYKFAVTGNRIYFAESEDYNTISCYSIYGERLYSFYVDMVIDYRTDSNGNLYIISRNQIYTVDTTSNYQPTAILGTVSIRGNAFVCDNTLFDYSGYIINLQDGTLIDTGIEGDNLNCAVINEYYCKYSDNSIFGYNKDGTHCTLYSITAGEKVQLCSYGDKLYLLSDSRELFIIGKDELSFPQVNNNTSDNSSTNNNNSTQNNNTQSTPSTNSQTNSNTNTTKKEFSINNYYIDANKNIIWSIPNGTTISTFKNNLTYNGYQLEFYNKENVKKTSGKIGTGYAMVVKENESEYARYTISVTGDLSGEGSVNKSDVKLLSQYLMNSATLTDEQYTASDCNGDGIINGVDVLKIAKNNL